MKTNFKFNKIGKYGVILTHGLLSNIDSKGIRFLEKLFNDNGFSTISFDIFGHGKSDGNIPDLTLSICLDQIFKMNDFFLKENIICKYVYGTSLSTLPILKFGNITNSIDKIFLKTPVFNFKEKREKELGIDKIKEWSEKGIIKIIDEKNGKPAVYQKYDFIRDYELNFGDVFLKNNKKLFIGAGIFDKEVDIEKLRMLKKNNIITLKEYNDGHRFSDESLYIFIEDILNVLDY